MVSYALLLYSYFFINIWGFSIDEGLVSVKACGQLLWQMCVPIFRAVLLETPVSYMKSGCHPNTRKKLLLFSISVTYAGFSHCNEVIADIKTLRVTHQSI